MSKSVITFVLKVLRSGLLRYIYFTHVQTCDNVRVQSASVHTLHMSKSVITDNEALFVGVAASGEGSSRSMGFLPCSGDLSWNHCD